MWQGILFLAAVAGISESVAAAVPNERAVSETCVFPEGYVVSDLVWWTPSTATNNTASPFLYFGYTDQNTSITTTCQWNSTSTAVGSPDETPRYACDNSLVEFIWENSTSTLDMIEKICPNSSGESSWEVSGEVAFVLPCVATACNSTTGDGSECSTSTPNVAVNFTALDPI